MGKYAGEKVLVIKRTLLDSLGAFQGAQEETERYLAEILKPENTFFIDREEAEEDPSHKQLIPYCIFKYEDRILHYLRGKSGGEARLHASGSIGVGGHINPIDASAESGEKTYRSGVEREIEEELVIQGAYSDRIIGLINDDSNDVGKVHLGVVHLVELTSPEISAREDCLLEAQLLPIEELRTERFKELESWSQLALSLLPE